MTKATANRCISSLIRDYGGSKRKLLDNSYIIATGLTIDGQAVEIWIDTASRYMEVTAKKKKRFDRIMDYWKAADLRNSIINSVHSIIREINI